MIFVICIIGIPILIEWLATKDDACFNEVQSRYCGKLLGARLLAAEKTDRYVQDDEEVDGAGLLACN
jgi:hypothetical protein